MHAFDADSSARTQKAKLLELLHDEGALSSLTDEESAGIIDLILLSQSKERIKAQDDKARSENVASLPFLVFALASVVVTFNIPSNAAAC